MNPRNIPPLSDFRHATPVQIRFNDVDVLGHVNNTVYFSYYDTGKARYFEAMLGEPIAWDKVEAVIANVDCAFVAPVFFGNSIEVLTRCVSVSDKSFKLMQVIADRQTGQVHSVCETVMVSFNPVTGEPCRVPDRWRTALARFEGHPVENQKNDNNEK